MHAQHAGMVLSASGKAQRDSFATAAPVHCQLVVALSIMFTGLMRYVSECRPHSFDKANAHDNVLYHPLY